MTRVEDWLDILRHSRESGNPEKMISLEFHNFLRSCRFFFERKAEGLYQKRLLPLDPLSHHFTIPLPQLRSEDRTKWVS